MFNTKKIAFTLTEILIALTIIGVVAAITIPKVATTAKVKSDVVKLRNAYSSFKEVLRIATANAGYDLSHITAMSNSNAVSNPRNMQDFLSRAFDGTARSGERYEYTAAGRLMIAHLEEDNKAIEFLNYNDSAGISTDNDFLLVGKNGAYYIFKPRNISGSTTSIEPCFSFGPCIMYIDINGSKGPNEIISCTEGNEEIGIDPMLGSSAAVYTEPAPCIVDDNAVTDIYPFFVFDSEVVPATSAVTAVLDK